MKTYGQIGSDAFIRHFFKRNISEKELDSLWAATPRPKQWWAVPRRRILEVCLEVAREFQED